MHGFTFPCIMRKGTGSLQISPCRLLSLLLLHIIAALAVQQVNGYRSSSRVKSSNSYQYKRGGDVPYVKQYRLMSLCSSKNFQMRFNKRINARGNFRTLYSVFEFESDPRGFVSIKGFVTNKYLCFSKRSRLIYRNIGDSRRCKFKEISNSGYTSLQSAVNPDWYVGFNSRGRKLRGYQKQSKQRRFRGCFMFRKFDYDQQKRLKRRQIERMRKAMEHFRPRNNSANR